MATGDQSAVRQLLNIEAQRTKTHVENIGAILSSLTEAAERLARNEHPGGVDVTKQSFKALLEVQHALQLHASAAGKLRAEYREPDGEGEETDFAAALGAAEQHFGTRSQFNAEAAPAYKEFLEEVRSFCPQPEAADSDDDLRIERGEELAPNNKCPLSATQLVELAEPVEDQVGFVYERKAITDYVRQHGGCAPCPVAGTQHQVRVADLKPARKVLRAQRRAQQQGTQAARADEADILDAV